MCVSVSLRVIYCSGVRTIVMTYKSVRNNQQTTDLISLKHGITGFCYKAGHVFIL